jgi:DNA-binding XRE family transcriptional regulator
MMKLSEVLPFFNGNKAELARQLDISRQAVTKWETSRDGVIPREHELFLRYELLPSLQSEAQAG